MKKRKQILETLKLHAKSSLEENLIFSQSAKGWEKHRVERNIFNLKNILNDLNKDLLAKNLQVFKDSSDAITNYKSNNKSNHAVECDLMPHLRKMLIQSIPFSVHYRIANNTIKNSIELDLNNPMHLKTNDVVEISLDLKSPEILVEYIPDMISKTSKILIEADELLENTTELKELTNTTLNLSVNTEYTASNIILMTLIEAYTLKFIESVIKIQNPKKSNSEIEYEIYKKYRSLDSLLKNISLKSDYQISYIDTQVKFSDSNHPMVVDAAKKFRLHLKAQKEMEITIPELSVLLNDTSLSQEEKRDKLLRKVTRLMTIGEKNMINDLERPIFIPVSVCLNFLRRRMYQDRNLLLHGQFYSIENSWKNYLFLNGIYKLGEVIIDYHKQNGK